MLKAFKYRLYPSNEQRILIDNTINCCRYVYNVALEVKKETWRKLNKNISTFDLCKQLTQAKCDQSWLFDVDSQALKCSILDIDRAYASFFKGGGFPKFKRKKVGGSFKPKAEKSRINIGESTISLPKIKEIPIILSRIPIGEIRSITISKTPTGKYFASILTKTDEEDPKKKKVQLESTIGIDLGLKSFAVTSDGKIFENPRFLEKSLDRLKILQRRASRKKRGSQNNKKANLKVAKQHEKITNQRKDFLHKTSSAIIKQYDTICLEKLSVKNMMKNHSLAKSISDAGWSSFVSMFEYKAEWNGKNILKIGTFEPSSKTCSCCGFVYKELSLPEREWKCDSCGSVHDRDLNAAVNIKNFGLRNHSRVGSPVVSVELCS